MSKNGPLIYESPDGGDTVYAKYRDNNKIPRWLVESNKQPDIFEFQDFEDCKAYAEDYPILKKQLDRLKTIWYTICLLYTSPSPRDYTRSRMPSSA